MFNGKKFSYAAAYDQSVIQKRSAGSLMAGLMYNYTDIDYAANSNGDLIYLMSGLGRIKLWQGSVGFDTRVSLTYNLGRYFFNVYGQFNNIRYHHNNTKGYLNDWFVNTSIGIRL